MFINSCKRQFQFSFRTKLFTISFLFTEVSELNDPKMIMGMFTLDKRKGSFSMKRSRATNNRTSFQRYQRICRIEGSSTYLENIDETFIRKKIISRKSFF